MYVNLFMTETRGVYESPPAGQRGHRPLPAASHLTKVSPVANSWAWKRKKLIHFFKRSLDRNPLTGTDAFSAVCPPTSYFQPWILCVKSSRAGTPVTGGSWRFRKLFLHCSLTARLARRSVLYDSAKPIDPQIVCDKKGTSLWPEKRANEQILHGVMIFLEKYKDVQVIIHYLFEVHGLI